MKLKKAGALGLSCVIALGSMAGCGSSKEEEKTDGKEEISGEIRYAFWDTAQQPYFEKCIEKFNEQYPDVKVTLEPSSWDEYWTKLEAGATGGSIADVFWMNGPNIMKYADGDVLMDISDRIKEDNVDTGKYPEALVELYNVDGKQYAIPKDFDTIGVWYNKKIFDEAGVPYPTDDWTWDDMADIAKQLTRSDGSVYGISAGYDTQTGFVQFLSGRLGMYWCGSWFLNQVLDSDIKDDIDVAPVPSINGKQATVIHGLGNCIYKDTKNPEAAWKWVEFLSGEEANKLSAEMGAAIPAYEGTADIWVDKNKAYNLSTFVTASKEYSYPYPVSKNTAEWEQYQAEELKKAYNFQVDVKDACDTLAEKMNEVLASE